MKTRVWKYQRHRLILHGIFRYYQELIILETTKRIPFGQTVLTDPVFVTF